MCYCYLFPAPNSKPDVEILLPGRSTDRRTDGGARRVSVEQNLPVYVPGSLLPVPLYSSRNVGF